MRLVAEQRGDVDKGGKEEGREKIGVSGDSKRNVGEEDGEGNGNEKISREPSSSFEVPAGNNVFEETCAWPSAFVKGRLYADCVFVQSLSVENGHKVLASLFSVFATGRKSRDKFPEAGMVFAVRKVLQISSSLLLL